MNQSGGLNRVWPGLAAKITGGQFAELVIDERNQFIKRGLIATAPLNQQLCDALICNYRLVPLERVRRFDESPGPARDLGTMDNKTAPLLHESCPRSAGSTAV